MLVTQKDSMRSASHSNAGNSCERKVPCDLSFRFHLYEIAASVVRKRITAFHSNCLNTLISGGGSVSRTVSTK